MGQLVSDPFTYSNGALTTVAPSAWAVESAGGSLEIISNEARANSVSGPALGRYIGGTPPGADYYVETTIGTVVSGTTDEGAGPAARISTGATTGYFVQCNTVESRLYRVVAGAFTQVGTDGAAVASGDLVRLEVSGTGATVTLVVKKNGSTIINTTDTSGSRITATGSYGFWASYAGGQGRLNDFAGGTVTTSSDTALSVASAASAAYAGTGLFPAAISVVAAITDTFVGSSRKQWRVPTTASNGTPVHVIVFSGTSPTYSILAQGVATVDASGFAFIDSAGTSGDKAFAFVHNYSDSTATTSIFGGAGIGTVP